MRQDGFRNVTPVALHDHAGSPRRDHMTDRMEIHVTSDVPVRLAPPEECAGNLILLHLVKMSASTIALIHSPDGLRAYGCDRAKEVPLGLDGTEYEEVAHHIPGEVFRHCCAWCGIDAPCDGARGISFVRVRNRGIVAEGNLSQRNGEDRLTIRFWYDVPRWMFRMWRVFRLVRR
jgi:hypothetical protein